MEKLPLDRVRWPIVALLASALMLGTAYVFQYGFYYQPCQMCWWQRYVYFAAGPVALVAVVMNWRGAGVRTMTALSLLIGAIFLVGFGIASYHALVEWHILPAPDTCTAVGPIDLGSGKLSDLLDKPIIPPSCKDAAWRDPVVHLSMAGWNAIVSFFLTAASLYSATQPPARADTANEPVMP